LNRKLQRRKFHIEALEHRTLLSAAPNVVNDTALTITTDTVYSSITGTGSLTIGTPTTPAVLQLADGGGVSEQASITINPGSQLDLGNNTFYINYGDQPDPISLIAADIQSGYNGGAWNGSGIVSSYVVTANAQGSSYGVGYADGVDGIVSGLSSGQIELMPTLTGDATLSGTVTFGDFQLLSQNFGGPGGWDQGDFDYQGTIGFGDFQLMSQNFGVSMPTPTLPASPLTETQATVAGGTQLQILGTQSGDQISLSQSNGETIVTDAGFAPQTFSGIFASIKIVCGNGNNSVTADSSVTSNLLIYGGTGNDTIVGGAGNDEIWGGGGIDSITAGSGNDTIVTYGDQSAAVTGGSGFDSFWINPSDTLENVTTAETAGGNVHLVTGVSNMPEPAIGMGGVTYQSFAGDPLFSPAGPSPNDIVQGDSGDCYFLATLSAMAQTDPNLIQQSIVQLSDGTFLVQFQNGSTMVDEHVDAELPAYSNGQPVFAQLGADNSLWVPIMEKAFAIYRDGADSYPNISSGWMSEVYSDLGLSSQSAYAAFDSQAEYLDTIQQDLLLGQVVTAGVIGVPSGDPLISDHAYSVVSVTVVDDVVTAVTLRNPWGTVGVDGLTNGGYETITAAQAYAGLYAIVSGPA
jgi:hypothetical protein